MDLFQYISLTRFKIIPFIMRKNQNRGSSIILDMEDSAKDLFSLSNTKMLKKICRSGLMSLSEEKINNSNIKLFIRVNDFRSSYFKKDIAAIKAFSKKNKISGIFLPKVETASQLQAIDWMVGQLEREKRLPLGDIDIVPIIETARGLANVHDIAKSETRVKRLAFGAGDYTKDIAMRWTHDEAELMHARAEIAVASRSARLEAPIDTVWIHINDTDGCVKSAKAVREMGYQGKLCIHPDQVDPVNAVFTPTDEDITFAEKVVGAFEQAESEGLASIQVDGYFVDYPIVDHAQRTLNLIKKIRRKS